MKRITKINIILGVAILTVGLSASALSNLPLEDECVEQSAEQVDKFQICEDLLNVCMEDSFLRGAGVERYKELQRSPTIPEYMELISECCEEDGFYDVIASTDEWDRFVEYVYDPSMDDDHAPCGVTESGNYKTWENAEGVKVTYSIENAME